MPVHLLCGNKTKPRSQPLVSARLSAGIPSRLTAAWRRNGLDHFFGLLQMLLNRRNRLRGKPSDYIVITVVCLSLKVPQSLLVVLHHVLRIGSVKVGAA